MSQVATADSPSATVRPAPDPSLTILELLASRICHDLISPVGAVNNGVEFLQDADPADMKDGLDLIAYSAAQASAKLQAFRLCYGAGGRDPNIKLDEVHRIFGEYLGGASRIKQDWDPKAVAFDDMPVALPKILLGTLILCTEIMPRGGIITVSRQETGYLKVTPTGQDVAPRPNMDKALDGTIHPDILDTRLIHTRILGMMLETYNLSIEPDSEGDILSFIIR